MVPYGTSSSCEADHTNKSSNCEAEYHTKKSSGNEEDLANKTSNYETETYAKKATSSEGEESANQTYIYEEDSAKKITKNKAEAKTLAGDRIVEIQYILKRMVELANHNPTFGCSLDNLQFVKEIHKGLKSILFFKCSMCNGNFTMHTQDPNYSPTHMDINTRAVAGIMSVGGGFSHLEELCASIGIPCMSSHTYSKVHDKVSDGWEKAALDSMNAAAKEEAELAVKRGDVDDNGIPHLTVVADGCWSKRSYRTKYNALSGVAAIVGFYTKKVLFMSVRNKFCFVCARTSDDKEIPQHTCYKNWTGSSTSMEANIVVEGFKLSESVYNVKYSKVIADGDSSCYKKILEARPYSGTTVEKIECRNHLLRNYCTKLRALSEQSKIGSPALRKLLSQKLLKLRRAVTEAVKHRKEEEESFEKKIASLQDDILNGPSHVFGEHEKCSKYFCSGHKEGEKNLVSELVSCGLFEEITKAVRYLAYNSRSLIYDVDSNVVEQFNSIIAKFVGGKRINYSQKRSYQARCSAAVVSHNTRKHHYVLHKTMCDGYSPNKFVKKLEVYRARKRDRAAAKRKTTRRTIITKRNTHKHSALGDMDYGPNCEKPDMTPDVFQLEKENLFKSLEKTDEERKEIQRATLLQAGSGEWLERRRKMLTASKFGRICRRRITTSCKNLVKNIMYSPNVLNVPALAYGRKNEPIALQQLEKQEHITVQLCGLFIDNNLQFLGATPDGLVGEDGLVEVKCPSSAAGVDLDKAVLEGKVRYLTYSSDSSKVMSLKTTHEYYYQIQGQLHITNRNFCLLAIWTSKEHPVKCIKIHRDDIFWKEKMEKQLIQFYNDCMVPELVDPRHTRNMEIRDPEYARPHKMKKAV